MIVLYNSTNNSLIEAAKTSLDREESRQRAKLEFDINKININCFKESIIFCLKKYNFQLRNPIFDEDDRLLTHIRNSKKSIFSDKNYFEEVVIAIRISKKNNKYRLYAVAQGSFRRRKYDLKSAEDIDYHLMDVFLDSIINDIDYEKCINKHNIYDAAKSALDREERRHRAKLEFNKSEIDIKCLKNEILISLKNNGFQIRCPAFDEDERPPYTRKKFKEFSIYKQEIS